MCGSNHTQQQLPNVTELAARQYIAQQHIISLIFVLSIILDGV